MQYGLVDWHNANTLSMTAQLQETTLEVSLSSMPDRLSEKNGP
jgi:hypothetical protein